MQFNMACTSIVTVAVLACLTVAHSAAVEKVSAPGEFVYGFGSVTGPMSLDKYDTRTGKLTHISKPYPKELSAQELSAIDNKKGVYYLLEFNETSRKPNLLGFSLTDGSLMVDMEIAFTESAFVGVGQYIAADDRTNCVIVTGADSSVKGYHVLEVCPFSPTKKVTSIAKIAAPAIGLLGSSSICDPINGYFYADMPLSPPGTESPEWSKDVKMHMVKRNSQDFSVEHVKPPSGPVAQPPPPPFEVDIVAVKYKGIGKGDVDKIRQNPQAGEAINTIAFDAKREKVVGFGIEQKGQSYQRTLVYLSGPKNTKFVKIGDVPPPYTGEMGAITAINQVTRTHYSLLQASKPWAPSGDCKKDGNPCPVGSLCCAFPPNTGACFNVKSCSALAQQGPFDLVGLNLDTVKVVGTPPKVCTIQDGKCPWSLEAPNM